MDQDGKLILEELVKQARFVDKSIGEYGEELREGGIKEVGAINELILYVSRRKAEEFFNWDFEEVKHDLGRWNDSVIEGSVSFIKERGIPQGYVEMEKRVIQMIIMRGVLGQEFREYEKERGFKGSPIFDFLGNDLRDFLKEYETGIAIARGGLCLGFYASLFDFPVGVVKLNHKNKKFYRETQLEPERLKDKKIIVFENDVVKGTTLTKFVEEIGKYKPKSLDLMLVLRCYSERDQLSYGLRRIFEGAKEKMGGYSRSWLQPKGDTWIRRYLSLENERELDKLKSDLESDLEEEARKDKAEKDGEYRFFLSSFGDFLEKDYVHICRSIEQSRDAQRLLSRRENIPKEFKNIFCVKDMRYSEKVIEYLFDKFNQKYHLLK